MAADLAAIVAAATSGTGPIISVHYLADRMGAADRPWPTEILFGLTEDEPRVVRDQGEGLTQDPRGAVCEVSCQNSNGRGMIVRVNYEKTPMVMVTAFYA